MNGDAVVVMITAPGKDSAEKLVAGILKEKLAACANIVPGVLSLFWWGGEIDRADETLVICKTRASLTERLAAYVREHHTYEVPEVIAVPIVGGNPDYLKWITENTVE